MRQELTTPGAGAPGASSETNMTVTRALLACGLVAGPLYVVVALLQVLFRDGFDLSRQPLSMLSLGDLGWIQITNFVVGGLLAVGFAAGLRRVLRGGRGGTWGRGCSSFMGWAWSPAGCSSPTRLSASHRDP